MTASNNTNRGLTIYNASSSDGTLHNTLIIATLGMPVVLTYTLAVHGTFRGKVELNEHSY